MVVIGGGVAGCSVAYHLAAAGWSDILLLEKGELTSGSTHHAAGLVTQFNPSATMMGFRRYSVELYHRLSVFAEVGSVRIAASPESLIELRRAVSRAAGIGLDAELMSPAEVLQHEWPEVRVVDRTALGRVYASIAELRRRGLRDLIVRNGAGYLLHEATVLRLV